MFAYGCATSFLALLWFAWACSQGGFDLPPGNKWFPVTVFAVYLVPHVYEPTPPAGGWRPLFAVTQSRVILSRVLLAVAASNIILWAISPWFGPARLFVLTAPAFALLSSLLVCCQWSIGINNILPFQLVRLFTPTSFPLLLRPHRTVGRVGTPKISLHNWLQGLEELATLIGTGDRLRDVWVKKAPGLGQPEDYIELYSNIFVVLQSEVCIRTYGAHLDVSVRNTLQTFLNELARFDRAFNNDTRLRNDASVLLSSPEWDRVRKAASVFTSQSW